MLKQLLAAVVLAAVAMPVFADTVVTVELWDKGDEVAENMGMGMGGDMADATMGITMEPASVPAGKVTFRVSNAAAETYHQMLLTPVADAGAALPYVADESRVDEAALVLAGEGVTLKGHDAGSVTLDLAPGTYAVFCNLAGHFMSGMWTTLEVTP